MAHDAPAATGPSKLVIRNIGLLLSGIVLFAFLRSWSTILVAVIVVPATLLSSVLLLSALGNQDRRNIPLKRRNDAPPLREIR